MKQARMDKRLRGNIHYHGGFCLFPILAKEYLPFEGQKPARFISKMPLTHKFYDAIYLLHGGAQEIKRPPSRSLQDSVAQNPSCV